MEGGGEEKEHGGAGAGAWPGGHDVGWLLLLLMLGAVACGDREEEREIMWGG